MEGIERSALAGGAPRRCLDCFAG